MMGRYAAIKSDMQRMFMAWLMYCYVKKQIIQVGKLSPSGLNQLQGVGIWGFYFSPCVCTDL